MPILPEPDGDETAVLSPGSAVVPDVGTEQTDLGEDALGSGPTVATVDSDASDGEPAAVDPAVELSAASVPGGGSGEAVDGLARETAGEDEPVGGTAAADGADHPEPAPISPVRQGGASPRAAWALLAGGLRLRGSRGQVLAGVLCALLGFAVVAQVRQTQVQGLSSLRQSDLVRILDDSTQRSEQLQREAATLESTRQDLLSGSDKQKAALEAATQRAATQGILSGRLPAHGPGIEITIAESGSRIPAMDLLNVLEELRNAGAEVVQLDDLRLTANSYFTDGDNGVVVDGVEVKAPYHWIAIGDPETMAPALEIPGGAMATVRRDGGTDTVTRRTDVSVTAVRTIVAPKYATAAPGNGN